MASSPKLKILFLCTGNSCRSQMAEGYARALKGELIEPYSGGVIASGVHPLAAAAMARDGVDISAQTSKVLDQFTDVEFDYVITLCDHAAANCPFFPGAVKRIHHPFDDPPSLAVGAKDQEEAMAHFRRVRDEIKEFVLGMPENLSRS